MGDTKKSGVVGFLSNGSGAITFRIATLAMATLTFGLLAYEGERLDSHLDRVEQLAQSVSARVDVHTTRLDNLDSSTMRLWSANHDLDQKLENHEHRISEIEGRQPQH